jgi:DNA-binding SARP family transcriptional activator
VRLLLRGAGRERADDEQDLRVHTLGALRVSRGETLLFDEGWPNKPAKTVFKALLTARGHALSSEALAEVVWPEAEPEVGANRLRVAVHDVRQRLGDLRAQGRPPRLIAHRGDGYTFDPEGRCWVDAHAFEQTVSRARDRQGQGLAEEALAAYREADALYSGDYLPDDPWADWLVATRERLRELHLTLLAETARLQAGRGAVEEAVRSCRRILRVEPWREEVYRQVMAYLAGAGRRGEALRAFEECRRALQDEEVEPAPATWQLRARIAAQGRQSAAAAVDTATSALITTSVRVS